MNSGEKLKKYINISLIILGLLLLSDVLFFHSFIITAFCIILFLFIGMLFWKISEKVFIIFAILIHIIYSLIIWRKDLPFKDTPFLLKEILFLSFFFLIMMVLMVSIKRKKEGKNARLIENHIKFKERLDGIKDEISGIEEKILKTDLNIEAILGIYDLNKKFEKVDKIEDALNIFSKFIWERYKLTKYFFLYKKVNNNEIIFEKYSSGFNLNHSVISSINIHNIGELEELFYQTGRVYIDDFSNSKKYYKLYAYFPAEEFISFPIIYDQQNIGLFILFSDKSNSFSQMFKGETDILSQLIEGILKKGLLYEQMEKLSITDGLTQIYSRGYFNKEIEETIEKSKRNKDPFCLVIFDIDYFKNCNDRCGHQFGDFVLTELVNLVKGHLTHREIFCRYGGEEFVIIFPGMKKEHVLRILEELRISINANEFTNNRQTEKITVSFGVAEFSFELSSKEIISQADKALYTAKETGRNKIVLYSEKKC
ncbi:MAG: GGDEF domain-containing protein [bacterium]|nr:GGDEF domain-containing protein [bacterium]